MLKYEYENATVYITRPTEKHIENIKKATEMFVKKVMKEEIQNEVRRHDRRTRINNPDARKRNKNVKTEN